MSNTKRLREQLYMLQGSRCFYCDQSIPEEERSLEHVVPQSQCGRASLDNGVVICEAANHLLGSLSPKQKISMIKSGGGKIECPKKVAMTQGVPLLNKVASVSMVALPDPSSQTRPSQKKAKSKQSHASRVNPPKRQA